MKDYYVVAVSHIDMGFVMREEAQEELVDILLERVIGVMERHPEIHFALEQAAHYHRLEIRRPDLFKKVKELLASGRMEFLGGMCTSAETNFPDGECLIRNQGMGLRWVQEHLGVTPTEGWLVDTFGLNAQIPQIMKQFGFNHLFANRFGGDKRYDLFLDEGLDGSRIKVIGKDSGSINVLSDSNALIFCRSWNDVDVLFREADKLNKDIPKLIQYYIENEEIFSEYYMKLTKQRNEAGNWKHSTYHEYCQALEQNGYEPPVLFGDLNPEFTGTFALRTPLRVANRRAETMLINAEIWDALLGNVERETKEKLENCWWDIFFNQFHDVFSGSHEDRTYCKVMDSYEQIQEVADQTLSKALNLDKGASTGFVCCNSLPFERAEWVEVPDKILKEVRSLAISDLEGRIPVCSNGNHTYFFAEMPAGGIKKYQILENAENERTKGKTCKKCSNEKANFNQVEPSIRKEISNGILRLVLDERDGIQCLEDSEKNCYISNAADFLVAQADRGGLQIERCEGDEIYAMTGTVQIGTVTSNEMGESITISGQFPAMNWNHRQNHLSWETEFSMRKEERALRVRLTVDWKGQETRIRFRIPCNIEGRDVFYEIPFGVTRREAYRNRPTARGEWPARRFTAMENGTRGIALINRGVAGVEQEGNALTTTLIRAYGDSDNPWIPPTDLTSQNGKQTFEFMIVPYEGNYKEADIISIAQTFNQPIQCFIGETKQTEDHASWYEINKKNLVLSTIKRAWDESGDLIVRIYESEGKETESCIHFKGLERVYESDVKEIQGAELEHNGDKLLLKFHPYEIRTLRVRKSVK